MAHHMNEKVFQKISTFQREKLYKTTSYQKICFQTLLLILIRKNALKNLIILIGLRIQIRSINYARA